MDRIREFIRTHSTSDDDRSRPSTPTPTRKEEPVELLYEAPGQHRYEGVYYSSGTPDTLIKTIKDDFKFGDGDVLIVTYPKSGKHSNFILKHDINLR